MEVGQTARRERGAARGELEELFPLAASHSHQHVDKLQEARRLLGVAQLGLRVLDDLLLGEDGVLVATQHGLDLGGSEGSEFLHGEHRAKSLSKAL